METDESEYEELLETKTKKSEHSQNPLGNQSSSWRWTFIPIIFTVITKTKVFDKWWTVDCNERPEQSIVMNVRRNSLTLPSVHLI